MSPEQITFFAKFIERELGIVYSDFNSFQLQNRLEEISRVLGLKDTDELYQLAQRPLASTVKQLLLDTATNNETSFFRDPKIFRAIQTKVLPELFSAGRTGGKVRIWSAACSAGQEPYTLSLLLREHGGMAILPGAAEIIATDISSRILEKASAGRYSQLEVQRGLPSPMLVKHFKKDAEDYWSVSPELRAPIRFQNLNLLDSFDKLGKFDLILCRNVLIYQSVERKKLILGKLRERLNPGGYLILGAGESMIGLSDDFATVKAEEALFFQPVAA